MEESPATPWASVFPEPAPIDVELYVRFVPRKLELVEGYLIDGPDRPKARLGLLALLLRNVGLKETLALAPRGVWEQAMRDVWGRQPGRAEPPLSAVGRMSGEGGSGEGDLGRTVMAFTVEDFQDLVRLLREHPEWREDLRRMVLAEELWQLPGFVQELANQTRLLAEAQRATEARLETLTARVEALAEAQRSTEQQLSRLAGSMEYRFQQVTESLDWLLERSLEERVRERAAAYFGKVFCELRVLANSEVDELLETAFKEGTITWEERQDVLEADVIARGRLRSTGEEAYLVAEVSRRVEAGDVQRAYRRAGRLQKVTGRAVAAVTGASIVAEARELAETLGVLPVKDESREGPAREA